MDTLITRFSGHWG